MQDELEQLVQELGYELIRVKGILDDDMCVLRRNMWGEIQFCWNYIDEVIDFILSTGAKPLLEFGHMPLLLAKTDPGRTMRPALSSSPRDLAEWRADQKPDGTSKGTVWNQPDAALDFQPVDQRRRDHD